jgi:phage terminase large subunit-like protein
MRWMVDNLVVKTDPAGNLKLDRQRSTDKIDGAIAAVMALDRALRHAHRPRSAYEDRDLEVV